MSFTGRTRIWTAGRVLVAALSVASLAGAPRAHAQAPAIQPGHDQAALVSERARVRAQLDRVNAEIDALKRAAAESRLGMRDDYRLRAKLADAEALARRLTELDARLGAPARPAHGD